MCRSYAPTTSSRARSLGWISTTATNSLPNRFSVRVDLDEHRATRFRDPRLDAERPKQLAGRFQFLNATGSVAAAPVNQPLHQRTADDIAHLPLEPLAVSSSSSGREALEHAPREALHEHRAQELERRGVAGSFRHHLHRRAERLERG